MKDLIKLVYDKLSVIGRTHLEEAPQEEPFPYIIFRFLPSTDDFQREVFILEVDIWGNDPDTLEIEALADSVDASLHRFKYYKKNVLQTSIYRTSREMVPDPDPDLRRRMLMFECKTYIKRSE